MLTGALVVGVDLSLKATGFADTRGRTAIITAPRGVKGYSRNWAITSAIVGRLRVLKPELVVIEGYAPHSIGIGSTIKAAELGGYLRTTLTVAGYAWVDVAPSELKKWATGNGAADKDAMVDAALNAGAVGPITHDEADAYLARAWGLHYLTEALAHQQETRPS